MVEETTTLRRCIGSARFGIEAHEAPVADFPAQPSQKDGLGRMCRVHWNVYTVGLARDAKARKAAEAVTATEGEPTVPEPVAPEEGPTLQEPVAPAEPAPRKRKRGAAAAEAQGEVSVG